MPQQIVLSMTDTLYIIGNGFDLHHELPTSYASFRDYAKKKQTISKWLNNIYGDAITNSEWWWQFEENLAKVDYTSLQKSLNGNGNAIGFQEVKNFLNNLPIFFDSWLNGIDINIAPDESLAIDPNSLFFTFNYTLLLERVYKVSTSNVWHIHNSLSNKKEKLIVGHDSDFRELFKLFLEEKENHPTVTSGFVDNVRQELATGAKNVRNRIYTNYEMFEKYSDIRHYIAMGFSFNDIDIPYIEKIATVNKAISAAYWTLYCHSKNDEAIIKGQLEKINVSSDNIETVNW